MTFECQGWPYSVTLPKNHIVFLAFEWWYHWHLHIIIGIITNVLLNGHYNSSRDISVVLSQIDLLLYVTIKIHLVKKSIAVPILGVIFHLLSNGSNRSHGWQPMPHWYGMKNITQSIMKSTKMSCHILLQQHNRTPNYPVKPLSVAIQ